MTRSVILLNLLGGDTAGHAGTEDGRDGLPGERVGETEVGPGEHGAQQTGLDMMGWADILHHLCCDCQRDEAGHQQST